MELLLSSRPKTIPGNYSIKGAELTINEPAGYSCTPEAWDKAERQESEYYDWSSYEACARPKVEHPAYAERIEDNKVFQYWEKVLNELEPLPRLQ